MQLVGDTADRDDGFHMQMYMSQEFRVGRAISGRGGLGWPARPNVPRLGRVMRKSGKREKPV